MPLSSFSVLLGRFRIEGQKLGPSLVTKYIKNQSLSKYVTSKSWSPFLYSSVKKI